MQNETRLRFRTGPLTNEREREIEREREREREQESMVLYNKSILLHMRQINLKLNRMSSLSSNQSYPCSYTSDDTTVCVHPLDKMGVHFCLSANIKGDCS
jgi:Zn/Cd-binding protein ZinT